LSALKSKARAKQTVHIIQSYMLHEKLASINHDGIS